MSLAIATPISRGFMPNPERQNKLNEIVRKVQALRNLTKSTGFYTTKSVGVLLANLSPDELVEVGEALELTPRELSRTR